MPWSLHATGRSLASTSAKIATSARHAIAIAPTRAPRCAPNTPRLTPPNGPFQRAQGRRRRRAVGPELHFARVGRVHRRAASTVAEPLRAARPWPLGCARVEHAVREIARRRAPPSITAVKSADRDEPRDVVRLDRAHRLVPHARHAEDLLDDERAAQQCRKLHPGERHRGQHRVAEARMDDHLAHGRRALGLLPSARSPGGSRRASRRAGSATASPPRAERQRDDRRPEPLPLARQIVQVDRARDAEPVHRRERVRVQRGSAAVQNVGSEYAVKRTIADRHVDRASRASRRRAPRAGRRSRSWRSSARSVRSSVTGALRRASSRRSASPSDRAGP